MKYKLKTAPSVTPVSVDKLKANLRITDTDAVRDAYLSDLLKAALDWAQRFTGRQFCRATYTAYIDSFPVNDLVITLGPVAAISSVKYYEQDASSTTTLASASYQLDNIELDAKLRFFDRPSTDSKRMNAVEIEFTTGWATAAEVPEQICDAILLYATDRYLNPENRVDMKVAQAESLLTYFKTQRF